MLIVKLQQTICQMEDLTTTMCIKTNAKSSTACSSNVEDHFNPNLSIQESRMETKDYKRLTSYRSR